MPHHPPHRPGHGPHHGPHHRLFLNHRSENLKRSDIANILAKLSESIDSDSFSVGGKAIPIPQSVEEFIIKYELGPRGDLVFKIETKWFEGSSDIESTSGELNISG